MRGVLIQDWVTIRGQDAHTTSTQGSSKWMDLGDFEDLTFFLDVREVSSAPKMAYQTSPTKQEGSFLPMLPAFVVGVGQRVDRVFTSTTAVPPARFLRWMLVPSGAGVWDITFRLWVAAYAWRKW